MEILRCEKLTKRYGSGAGEVTALNGIDLSVEKGEFVAVMGASGSGKSTLLHILGTVDRPTSGRVVVDGTVLGNNQYLAQLLQGETGGDLFPIETVQTYPGSHDALLDFAY